MDVPESFPWDASDATRALLLLQVIERAPPTQRASFLMDLREANVLADEPGYQAILNACHPDHDLATTLRAMPGYAERALWTHWSHWSVLDHALAIRQVDEYVLAHRSERIVVPGAPRPVDNADDYNAFAEEVESQFRWRERSEEQAMMTVARRYRERAIQFVLHVDHLADMYGAFPVDGTHPSCVRPPVRLAVIYYEATGVVETIVTSGKPYHQMLSSAFIRHVLEGAPPVSAEVSYPYPPGSHREQHADLHGLEQEWHGRALGVQLGKTASSMHTSVDIAPDGSWLRVNGRELRLRGKQRDFALVMVQAYRKGYYRPKREWALRRAGYGPSITDLKQISTRDDFLTFFGYGDGEVWIAGTPRGDKKA